MNTWSKNIFFRGQRIVITSFRRKLSSSLCCHQHCSLTCKATRLFVGSSRMCSCKFVWFYQIWQDSKNIIWINLRIKIIESQKVVIITFTFALHVIILTFYMIWSKQILEVDFFIDCQSFFFNFGLVDAKNHLKKSHFCSDFSYYEFSVVIFNVSVVFSHLTVARITKLIPMLVHFRRSLIKVQSLEFCVILGICTAESECNIFYNKFLSHAKKQ